MIERRQVKSKALESDTVLTVIRPDHKPEEPENQSIVAVLILLHGMIPEQGRNSIYENLPKELGLQEISDKYHLLIAMPLVKNCFYISQTDYDCDSFISKEIPVILQKEYSFTKGLETILGGISMGGYGASLIGAHTDTFNKLISVSGAFIIEDIMIGNPEIWGSSNPEYIRDEEAFLNYFKPFGDLENSIERNAFQAIRHYTGINQERILLMTCGTDDWLYEKNKRFLKQLTEAKISLSFLLFSIEGGKHEADCFQKGLTTCLDAIFK